MSLTIHLTLQVELKSTIECLHEEQERIIKIETIKKSLEVEVKVNSLDIPYYVTLANFIFFLHCNYPKELVDPS